MPSDKVTFVVRDVAFFYTDEFYVPSGLGSVRGTYETREDADAACAQYQRSRLRAEAIYEYVSEDPNALAAALAFFVKHFPESGVNRSTKWFPPDVYVPKKATDAQIDGLLVAMKAEFARVFELPAGESFHAVKVHPARLGEHRETDEACYLADGEGVLVLGTREDCHRALNGEARAFFENGDALPLPGGLEEASELPEALEAFIRANAIIHDEEGQSLCTGQETDADFVALFALLREPPMEIVAVPLRNLASLHRAAVWPDPFEA